MNIYAVSLKFNPPTTWVFPPKYYTYSEFTDEDDNDCVIFTLKVYSQLNDSTTPSVKDMSTYIASTEINPQQFDDTSILCLLTVEGRYYKKEKICDIVAFYKHHSTIPYLGFIALYHFVSAKKFEFINVQSTGSAKSYYEKIGFVVNDMLKNTYISGRYQVLSTTIKQMTDVFERQKLDLLNIDYIRYIRGSYNVADDKHKIFSIRKGDGRSKKRHVNKKKSRRSKKKYTFSIVPSSYDVFN